MPPTFRALPLNAIIPQGWIKAQLNRDLEEGFAGRLDQLTPHAANDLFRHRISSSQEQLAWWDSETRGNWLWGYVMMAYISGNSAHISRVSELLNDLKNTQDSDGYLGIYGPEWRYNHPPGENGELWGQSRALLPMLAYYELSGDASFLSAVERAVRLTMQHYGKHNSYFRPAEDKKITLTGVTHGLCYVDVVEWLYRLTGNEACKEFGQWLYEDFNQMPAPFQNDDIALANLLDPHEHWRGHAAHTVEHLRALVWAAVASGNEQFAKAFDAALNKLQHYQLPGGAVLGDEWLHGLPDPEIGYEYCTMTELLLSLSFAQEKLGRASFGDMIENLVFNAGQGARLPNGEGVAYLSCDTRLKATGEQPDSFSYLDNLAGRFKYSPTHEDVACCCNPNSIRFMPHFVSRMWFGCEDGIAAVTYGPGRVKTTISGVSVEIDEDTDYPFSNRITFTVNPQSELEFTLYLRKPGWSPQVQFSLSDTVIKESDGYFAIHKLWRQGDTIEICFNPTISLKPYPKGEYAVFYGPLQFVLPIEPRFKVTKDYRVSNLHDYDIRPLNIAQAYKTIILDTTLPDFGLEVEAGSNAKPVTGWDESLIRLRSGSETLIPFGSTILRRAAFPLKE